MLTLKLLREQPEYVIKKLAVKNFDAKEIVEKINALDADRRELRSRREFEKPSVKARKAKMKAIYVQHLQLQDEQ